jgi:hypothetical protein
MGVADVSCVVKQEKLHNEKREELYYVVLLLFLFMKYWTKTKILSFSYISIMVAKKTKISLNIRP